MKTRRLSSAVGTEIQDIDLREPLKEEDFLQMKQAFLETGVLIVRNQDLSADDFVRFATRFGDIESYASTLKDYLKPGHPEIIMLSNIVENGKPLGVQDAGQYWHTDRSYVERPAWLSALYSLKIPHDDGGNPLGDTMFSNATAALLALSDKERKELESMSAWHEYVFRFSKKTDVMPGVAHPIVLHHPITNAPVLYVNAGFTHHVMDVSDSESKALLEKLYAHIARDEFVYRHKWKKGDVLLWDNYSTQHRAVGDYGPDQHRLMWRTTIQGVALDH
jgi:taurine dioxygenase